MHCLVIRGLRRLEDRLRLLAFKPNHYLLRFWQLEAGAPEAALTLAAFRLTARKPKGHSHEPAMTRTISLSEPFQPFGTPPCLIKTDSHGPTWRRTAAVIARSALARACEHGQLLRAEMQVAAAAVQVQVRGLVEALHLVAAQAQRPRALQHRPQRAPGAPRRQRHEQVLRHRGPGLGQLTLQRRVPFQASDLPDV